MSKTKKQKQAEETFNQLVYNEAELSFREWKKICLEMYKQGYWDCVDAAAEKITDLY